MNFLDIFVQLNTLFWNCFIADMDIPVNQFDMNGIFQILVENFVVNVLVSDVVVPLVDICLQIFKNNKLK